MNWLDILIIVVSAILMVIGSKVGLFRAVFLVGGLVVALLLAGQISDPFADLITESVGSDATASVIAYVGVVLVVLVAAQITGKLVRGVFRALFLGWVDGLGGAALGAGAGLLMGGALVALLARLAFLVPDGVPGTIGPIEVRDNLKSALTGSALVPGYISLKNALPGSTLGFVPGDFKSALDELKRIRDEEEENKAPSE